MARDYEMIRYIRNQMKGFDDRFINVVVKLFGRMVDAREPKGCLSNSAMLLACANLMYSDIHSVQIWRTLEWSQRALNMLWDMVILVLL